MPSPNISFTINNLVRLLKTAQDKAKNKCQGMGKQPSAVAFQKEISSSISGFAYNLPAYLQSDRVFLFRIQPMRTTSTVKTFNNTIGIEIVYRYHTPADIPLNNSVEMELTCRFVIDKTGRMEYMLQNFPVQPPGGGYFVLAPDGVISLSGGLDNSTANSIAPNHTGNNFAFHQPQWGAGGSGNFVGEVNSGGGSNGFDDYLAAANGAVNTYTGVMGDAFYSKYHHMQKNGIIRSAKFAANNPNKIYQTSRSGVEALTKNARMISKGTGMLGSAISVYQFANEPTYANLIDGIAGATTFIPVVGWAISGTYFITNLISVAYDGKTIGERIAGDTRVW